MLIEYGDFEVRYESLTFLFRPTFKNIHKIGTPVEIIEALHYLYYSDAVTWLDDHAKWLSKNQHIHQTSESSSYPLMVANYAKQSAIKSAVLVLQSCCDQDISSMTGTFLFGKKLHYKPGFENIEVLIELARHLVRHGVIGVSKKKSTNKRSEPIKEFNASYHASVAINHLEMCRSDAWDLSMSEFLHHLEVRNPDDDDKIEAKISRDKNQMNACDAIRERIKEQRNG